MYWWYLFFANINSNNIYIKVFDEVDIEEHADEDFSTLKSKNNDEILITDSDLIWGYIKAESKYDAELKLNKFLIYYQPNN